MIVYALLRLPHEIRNVNPSVLYAYIGIGIALIGAIVVFVWKVITVLVKVSLRNDLD